MSSQSTSARAELLDRTTDRLFARFAAMYGDAAMKRMWGQQEPSSVKAVWAGSLGRLEFQQITAGLRNLEEDGNTFPPTLPEFVAACRRRPEVTPPEHRPLIAPPSRTAEEIAAGKAMAERIVRASSTRTGHDPAAWAYRVVARYRSGDRAVAHASYKTAVEALQNLGREVPA